MLAGPLNEISLSTYGPRVVVSVVLCKGLLWGELIASTGHMYKNFYFCEYVTAVALFHSPDTFPSS